MRLALVVALVAAALAGAPPAHAAPQPVAERPIELPDGGLVGTPSAPQDRQRVDQRRAAQSAPAARNGVTGYTKAPGPLTMPPVGQRPYDTPDVTPVEGYGLVDAAAVRMFHYRGITYNHPVAQAQYALANLNSHRLTGRAEYLDIAAANGARLVERRVESDGAWYFPYDFDYAPLGDTSEMLYAPWYSAMAQGQALSAFVRLFQATGDEQWMTAAHATFASLQQAPDGPAPYGSWIDEQRRLWLEEYPRYPDTMGEKVLNGHVFAIFGLLDHWAATADPAAEELALGAIHTVGAAVMTEFRQRAGLSLYSLRHRTRSALYHQIHIDQMLHLWQFTGDPAFVNAALFLRGDYPRPQVAGTMRATPKTSTIHQLDPSGRIVRSKVVRFSRATSAPADRRLRITGGPVAVRVSAGPYADWWFPEAFGVTWLLGATDVQTYAPPVRVVVAAGSYSAYRMNAAGEIVGAKTASFPNASSAPTAVNGYVQGRPAYYFTTGAFAGHWLPMQARVTLAGP